MQPQRPPTLQLITRREVETKLCKKVAMNFSNLRCQKPLEWHLTPQEMRLLRGYVVRTSLLLVMMFASINFLPIDIRNILGNMRGSLSGERLLRYNKLELRKDEVVNDSPVVMAAQGETGTAILRTSESSTGSVAVNRMEQKCRDQQAWNTDKFWRNAVLKPEICNHLDVPDSAVQLSLLNEMLVGSNADFTPCGAYCIYHLDSAYSYQYGHSIYGWVLRKQSSTSGQTKGCWEPFNSRSQNMPHTLYYYNDWIGYVEDVELKQRKLPAFDHSGRTDSSITQNAIQEQMEQYRPKCTGCGNLADNFDSKTPAPFCHFRSYDGGGNSVKVREMEDVDINDMEFRKNLKPSEIVTLFDREHLGVDDLSHALTLMKETFADINATSCNANDRPEHLVLCVYHRHSIPRTITIPGQFGSEVPIKGWQYRTLDRCFIPIENMDYSMVCGRGSEQYKAWSRYMSEHQDHIGVLESSKKPAPNLSKCDRIPLSLGRHTWDHNANEYVYLPPLPASGENPDDGVEYSPETVCGPRLLIVGAMKCGTNTIGTLLSHHPRIQLERCSDKRKPNCDMNHFLADSKAIWENHGLTHKFVEDPINFVGKYAQKLPVTEEYDFTQLPNGTYVAQRGSMTFDKSPSYLNTDVFPNVADRAKQLFPNAKIVITLCNPVERLYSEYHHEQKKALQKFRLFFEDRNVAVPTNFTEFVNHMKFSATICSSNPMYCDELRRIRLTTGVFHRNVRAWRNSFGSENVLVLNMDESSHDKMKKIISLVGPEYLPEHEYPWDTTTSQSSVVSYANTAYSGRSSGYEQHPHAFQWLRGYFYRHNVALAKELDAEWPLLWNSAE